jgi:hypothetical protein
VSTDHGSPRLKVGTNLSIVESCLVWVIQNFDVPQIFIQGDLVFLPPT